LLTASKGLLWQITKYYMLINRASHGIPSWPSSIEFGSSHSTGHTNHVPSGSPRPPGHPYRIHNHFINYRENSEDGGQHVSVVIFSCVVASRQTQLCTLHYLCRQW
jgi:hypothetical protein